MALSFINIHKVPQGELETSGYVLDFQHSPRDLANVNEWKIMFDPSINFFFRYFPSFTYLIYLIYHISDKHDLEVWWKRDFHNRITRRRISRGVSRSRRLSLPLGPAYCTSYCHV